jgi:hypothetical protein
MKIGPAPQKRRNEYKGLVAIFMTEGRESGDHR